METIKNENMTVEKLQELGKKELEDLLHLTAKEWRFYYNRAADRGSEADHDEARRYFCWVGCPEDDAHELNWFMEGLKKIGNFGYLLIGCTTLTQNDLSNPEADESLKTILLEEADKIEIPEEAVFTIDDLREIGRERQTSLTEKIRDRISSAFGYDGGLELIGLITVKEIEAMFDKINKSSADLVEKGFINGDIRFDEYTPDNGPTHYDLLLLRELYGCVFAVLSNRENAKPEEERIDVAKAMYSTLVKTPWAGYMELFKPGIIPESEKLKQEELDSEKLRRDYEESKKYNQSGDPSKGTYHFLRENLLGYETSRANNYKKFLYDLWGIDLSSEEPKVFKTPEDEMWYSIAEAYLYIRNKLYKVERIDEDDESYIQVNQSGINNYSFFSNVETAAQYWRRAEELSESTGIALPKEPHNPIKIATGSSFVEAMMATLTIFFSESRGTVGEWTNTAGKTILINPERLINRKESLVQNINPRTIASEQEAAEKRAENQTKELVNPEING